MFEITTEVNGKKVPIDKFADTFMDAIKTEVLKATAENIREQIYNLNIDKDELDKVKINIEIQGEGISINVEGPDEIVAQIQTLFEDEEDSE